MKFGLILTMLLVSVNIYGDFYNRYYSEPVAEFKIGDMEEELSYSPMPVPGESEGPGSFAFDQNGHCFINDIHKSRFVVLDSIYSIKEYITYESISLMSSAKQLTVTPEGIIGNSYGTSIGKLSFKGQSLFRFSLYDSTIYKKFDKSTSLVLGNSVIYYDKDKNPYIFPSLTNDEKQNIANVVLPESFDDYLYSLNADDYLNQYTFINGGVIKDGIVHTSDFRVFDAYWNHKKKNSTPPEHLFNMHGLGMDIFKKPVYLGSDNDGNMYWNNGKTLILVFNKDGWIIDIFFYEKHLSKTYPAVHPNGDIYLLNYDETKVTLNKITRKW